MVWDSFWIARDIARIYELASTLIRYGFGDIVRRIGLGDALKRADKVLDWKRDEELIQLEPPQRIRKALEDMGPTFVKLGQLLATRVDLFPKEWITEFEKLQSHAPPLDFEEIRPQLEEDLGDKPENLFAEFDTEPFGSASIAQVHRATLLDGNNVILKIRRPNVRNRIESDLRLLRYAAEIAQSNLQDLRRYKPVELIRQFTATMRGELDLAAECRNAERVAESMSDNKFLVVPKVYWEWSCERLNVQEHIDGVKGEHISKLDEIGLDRKTIAEQGASAVVQMVIRDGFFHADPHPGNLIFLYDGRVAFIDWGMIGRLSSSRREQLVDFLLGLVERDSETVVDIMVEWAGDEEIDESMLTIEVENMIDKHHGVALKNLNITDIFNDILRLLYKYHLTLPPDLAIVLKVFITLEGLGRRLDPDFVLAEQVKPILQKVYLHRYSPSVLARRGRKAFTEAFDLLTGLPREIRLMLKTLKKGSLQHNLSVDQLDSFSNRIDNAVTRLSVSLVTAAFIIGASLVVAADKGTTIIGIPLFEIFGYCAFFGGVWFLITLWRGKKGK